MSNFNFKDFGIKPKLKNTFIGEKIKIKNILNVSIKVLDYKIEDSKVKAGTKLLTMQIEKNGDKRIVFSGSVFLIDMIEQVPKDSFPFETVIVGEGEHYEFT